MNILRTINNPSYNIYRAICSFSHDINNKRSMAAMQEIQDVIKKSLARGLKATELQAAKHEISDELHRSIIACSVYEVIEETETQQRTI